METRRVRLDQPVQSSFPAEARRRPIRTSSCMTLKRILGGCRRVTATLKRDDRHTLHVRKVMRPEAKQRAILDALEIASSAEGTHQALV